MSKSTAILGKAGVGKTFLAAHLGMAFGYLGDKTLVVGCDQKRDTMRALSGEVRPSLMETLEASNFAYDQVALPAGADAAMGLRELDREVADGGGPERFLVMGVIFRS